MSFTIENSIGQNVIQIGRGNLVADGFGSDPRSPYKYVSEYCPSGHKRKTSGYVLIEAIFGLIV